MNKGLLMRRSFKAWRSLATTAAIAGLLATSPLLQAKAAAPELLAPETVHAETLKEIYKTLRSSHYRKVTVNDSFSSRLLDTYLEQLDPSRSYFLRSDIDEFEAYRKTLDDDIRKGRLTAAYQVFNRFQQRRIDRIEYLLDRLEQGIEAMDFSTDESLLADRKGVPWARDQVELDELWRKRLKSAVLGLKLADKPVEDIPETLKKRYTSQLHRFTQTNSDDAFQFFANAYTSLYGPHTQYFSPRKSENFNINMSLSLEGIGAVLQTEDENTKVVRLIPSGPADKSGLLGPSDLITGVAQGDEGEMVDVVGWRLDEVVELIRGPKETVVRLEIIDADSESKQRKEVRIVRNEVKLEEQAARKDVLEIERDGQPYRLGVISIPTFYIDFNALQRGDPDYKSTTRDVERLLGELMEEAVDGLIVDLRNNGGGSLREANELVGLFIPQGPVVQIRDSWGNIQVMNDLDTKLVYRGPMAVLVNRLSASASEIFAGAIQDYSRGLVLGSQTFGKGTVQSMQPLSYGQLKLTHAKFYRISGDSTQNKGIVPDISFPSLYDPQEIGESALDEALPWDQARPVRHGRSLPDLSTFVQNLTSSHQRRIETEPDFAYIQQQITRLQERRSDKELSLNESTVRKEREAAEQWQLQVENERRNAKGLPPVDKLSELEVDRDHQGKPKDISQDAILRESGEVLLDLIGMVAPERIAGKSH